MSKASRFLIGTSLVIFVTAVAAFFLLRSLVMKSFPVTKGTLAISGLHKAVEVYRDESGVPHVLAADEHDLMMTVGYVHAQDRLWQLDLMRRAGEDRLSEILGNPTLAEDPL